MINVKRPIEIDQLEMVELEQLDYLISLGSNITSEDINGYQIAGRPLWKSQQYKCCYCELKIGKSFNDVEHYRPKGRSNRLPGCTKTEGYWWLAFSLSNLLFSCPSCNRTGKNDRFPLASGCTSLNCGEEPPNLEDPLFIDPAGMINPVEHIRFVPFPAATFHDDSGNCNPEWNDDDESCEIWLAIPRNGSHLGLVTIDVADLNRMDLLELRADHVRTNIRPVATDFIKALCSGDIVESRNQKARVDALIRKAVPFTALAYDALKHMVPSALMLNFGMHWMPESLVGTL